MSRPRSRIASYRSRARTPVCLFPWFAWSRFDRSLRSCLCACWTLMRHLCLILTTHLVCCGRFGWQIACLLQNRQARTVALQEMAPLLLSLAFRPRLCSYSAVEAALKRLRMKVIDCHRETVRTDLALLGLCSRNSRFARGQSYSCGWPRWGKEGWNRRW